MLEIKVYKSKWKAVKLLAISSPFVAIGIYMIQSKESFWGWLCIFFFGLGVLIALFNLLDNRPELVITDAGLFSRMSYGIFSKQKNKGFIKWNYIENAYLKVHQNSYKGLPTSSQRFISIALNEVGKKEVTISKLSTALGLSDYTIPLMNLKIFDELKFIELIKLLAHADNNNKKLIIEKFKNTTSLRGTKQSQN